MVNLQRIASSLVLLFLAAADLCHETGKAANAGFIELLHWEASLPYPGKKPTKISKKQIKAGYHDKYIHADSDGNLVFCAPADATTSAHSEDPRSELKEDDFDYPMTEGTVREMNATLKVLVVGMNKYHKKLGGPTIGQIHANSQDYGSGNTAMLKLRYDPIDAKKGTISATMKKDTKGNADHFKVVDVGLGEDITYHIRLDGFKLNLVVNGKSVSFDYSFLKKNSHDVRFRAGAYCDAPSDDPNSGCLVKFSALSTYHSWARHQDASMTSNSHQEVLV